MKKGGASDDAVAALLERRQWMGLWNRLTAHQERRAAFRLVRFEVPPDREGVARIALVRRQEIDGFVEGLFGNEEAIELPERAHQALSALSEMRAMFAGIVDLMADRTKPATSKDLAQVLRNIQQLTIAAETEIHKAVLSCTRARRHAMSGSSAPKPAQR
jgi:hypothetical protein